MYELVNLFVYIILGNLIGIIFDTFRTFRKTFKTSDFITTIQDLIFWLLAGTLILICMFKFSFGEIRSYMFIGMALGLVIYFSTISKFFIKHLSKVIIFIKKAVIKIFAICKMLFIKFIKKPYSKYINKFKYTIKKIQILTQNNKKKHICAKNKKNPEKN